MPVRNKSASFCASTLSLLLPSFNKALRRGLQTTMCCTCGCSRSYSQAAQVPSSQVTWSSPRRPWRNCRMLLALVSRMVSMTSFLVHVHADILDLATHCSCLLGGKVIPANAYLSLKVTCHSPADLPRPSATSFLPHTPLPLLSSRRSGAKPGTAQRSGGGATSSLHLRKQGALS